MIQVFKRYTKGLKLVIVFIAALLFIQAQCELALPDYMSDIVTYGIQSGGVDYRVPKMMSAETFNNIQLFTDDKADAFIQDSYTFVSNDDLDIAALPYQVSSSKNANGIYVLDNSISKKNYQKLEKALGNSVLITYSMSQMADDKQSSMSNSKQAQQMKAALAKMPEGSTVFDVLAHSPQQVIDDINKQFNKTLSAYGKSASEVAISKAIVAEYDRMGVDTMAIETNYIANVGATMLLIAVGAMIATMIVAYLGAMSAAKISMRLRKSVFERVENFSTEEFDHFSTASLITRSTNDIQQVQFAIVMILRLVIFAPIMGVGAIIRVVNSSTSMVWIIALIVVVIIGFMSAVMMVAGPKFKKMQSLVDRLNLVMREALSGMLVIRAFHNEAKEETRFEEANQDITSTQMFTSRTMALMMPMIMFIMNVTGILIVWFGSKQIDLGTLQIGDMMAFIQYAMQIIISFMFVAMIAVFLPRAGVAAARCIEVIDMPLSITDQPETQTFGDQRGLIEFRNVSFKYPLAQEEVLTDISFVARPGETTAFIGSTGSGKSTIINLIPRFYDVSSGQILVDGLDVKDVAHHELRDKIGLVPQKGVLFQGTIASNIKYSDPNMSDERMQEAADIAQASEFIDAKPEGFNSEIAQGGSNVSGGQRQRISIARAIAKQPEIFIFDDSFSALDFKTDAMVREGLHDLCKKTQSTMLLVGQRIASIMHAEQIIVLDEGKIVGKGTHDELMKNCEVYREIALSQLSKEELA